MTTHFSMEFWNLEFGIGLFQLTNIWDSLKVSEFNPIAPDGYSQFFTFPFPTRIGIHVLPIVLGDLQKMKKKDNEAEFEALV